MTTWQIISYVISGIAFVAAVYSTVLIVRDIVRFDHFIRMKEESNDDE